MFVPLTTIHKTHCSFVCPVVCTGLGDFGFDRKSDFALSFVAATTCYSAAVAAVAAAEGFVAGFLVGN